MRRMMLKSKIHRCRVTEACIDYEGSVSIDAGLLEAADILEYERVDIYNVSNGERFSTYAICGDPGSGVVCLNGAAARKVAVNDIVIICSYVDVENAEARDHRPRNVYVDARNAIVAMKRPGPGENHISGSAPRH
jgi:aspartate 1-decarboxylase